MVGNIIVHSQRSVGIAERIIMRFLYLHFRKCADFNFVARWSKFINIPCHYGEDPYYCHNLGVESTSWRTSIVYRNGQGMLSCILSVYPLTDFQWPYALKYACFWPFLICRLQTWLLLWHHRALYVKKVHLITLIHLEVNAFLCLGPLVYQAQLHLFV